MSDVKNSIVSTISNYLYNLQYLARVSNTTQRNIMLLIMADDIYDGASGMGAPQTEINKLKSFRKCIIQNDTKIVDEVTRTNEFYKNVNTPQTIYTWQRVYDNFSARTFDDISIKSDVLYGRLYNRHTILDPRLLAPAGWHVPSFDEWTALINNVITQNSSDKLKESGTTHWSNTYPEVTNETGFTALPAGQYASFYHVFADFRDQALFGSSNFNGSQYESAIAFNAYNGSVATYGRDVRDGFSIRLIRNEDNTATTLTDVDGNFYTTVTIGTQTGLKQNGAATHYVNGDPILTDFNVAAGPVSTGAYGNPDNNSAWVFISTSLIT